MEMKWCDPPEATNPRNTGKGRWFPVREELKANPGKWALLEEDTPMYRKNNFHNMFKKKDGYQVTTRSIDGNRDRLNIWVRYVGTEE